MQCVGLIGAIIKEISKRYDMHKYKISCISYLFDIYYVHINRAPAGDKILENSTETGDTYIHAHPVRVAKICTPKFDVKNCSRFLPHRSHDSKLCINR